MPTDSEAKAAALRHSQTRNKHVVCLSWSDRSGIVGVYGPYDSAEDAKAAIEKLQGQPAASSGGYMWEIYPLVNVLFL